ncbi:MAG: methylmalonyl-CoA carboxyltransferase [Clostridiales bacterium]|nr:methylmalonyl-CoA carboxyltransferase [Clostridiales bacterium]
MHHSQDLQQVLALREAMMTGDEQRLKEQRAAGKWTARERIAKLVDEGSFVELFALAGEQDMGAGVITGYATVQERPVYLFAQDFTIRGGAMGKLQAQKITKVLDMAHKTGAPIVALCDSAGVKLDEGAQAMNAYSEIYQRMARLSGVCPMIALVLGPCIGGAALLASLADVSIMAKKVGQLMVFGPQVLAAMNGVDVKPEALGGAEAIASQGGCTLVAEDEAHAMALAVRVLSMLPSSNLEDAEIIDSDDMNRLLPALDPADVDSLWAALADNGQVLEFFATYETSIRVALTRMGGRTVGLVATAKGQTDGKLTSGALTKAAQFVRLMDCYNIPVVSLMNTRGVYVADPSAQISLIKAQSQLLYAYAEATVPKLCVVTGDAIGQAYVAMGGKANADVTYAWPSATISALTPEAAVAVLYKEQIAGNATIPVEEARRQYADEYVRDVAGALNAAKAGLVDDVIDPDRTRALLISALEMLASKRDSNPAKKHGNIPL